MDLFKGDWVTTWIAQYNSEQLQLQIYLRVVERTP